jgi:SAM-dependent methyltransferase
MKNLLPLALRRSLGGWWHSRRIRLEKRALLQSLRGTGTQCNVCGWEGAKLTDDCWHPGTICPECGSQVRHRMLAAALDGCSTLPGLEESSLLAGKTLLHFAPERQLRDRLRQAAAHYASADFDRGDCDRKLDISSMPEIPNSSQDVLIACDVLEHVPDDAAAVREIHRVLRPQGTAILTVPQMDPPSHTDEDPSVISEQQRALRFGQKDHVRIYGDDFQDRLARSGFAVVLIDRSAFPENLVSRHVLHPPVLNPDHLATNHRRLYFCRKESGAGC